MKLYIWFDPYSINYGGCALYVVAPTLRAARNEAKNCIKRKYGIGGEPGGNWIDADNLGEPDVERNLPCAELYEWSE